MTTETFQLLHNRVRGLASARFKEPTTIQKLAIPKVLEGKNVLIIAATGIGKTESAMLPIFSKLVEKEHKPIALLYITPLKSLNRDMFDRLLWWCQKLDLDASVRHGDTTQYERKLQTEHPPHLLISTPEQLQGMLTGKRFREHLSNIKYIIVDELHELVQNKRGVQLTLALERLKNLCGKPQIIALSATVGSPETAAKFIFSESDFEIVKAVSEKDISISVDYPVPKRHEKEIAEKIFIGDALAAKLCFIHDLMKHHRSVLAFTNTREAAEVLSSRLRLIDKEFPHDIHHSSLSKEVRIKAEKDFKEEKLKALFATSSLELGIDIGAIDLVIQYQSPRQVTKLIQRTGRSGHSIHKKSIGVIVAGDGDDLFESSVIARKALAGEMEGLFFHKNALDVLAHQIIGLTIENYEMDVKKAYETVKRSYVYSSLTEKEFLEIVKFLGQLKLLWINGNKIKRSRKAFEYYFENLSTIPEVSQYRVIDVASSMPVGVLDEQFVAEHNESGSTFIVKGRPWRVVSVDNDRVYVEPSGDIESSIPAWEGELIPVPYEIAQEVGRIRRTIAEMLEKKKESEIVLQLKNRYPISSSAAHRMISIIKKQLKKGAAPTDKEILMEKFGEYVIIHTCLGSKINETLSRFISTILSAEYGSGIASKSDPYRIIIRGASPQDVKRVLFEYKPQDTEALLDKSVERTSIFKWRFIFVAKRFGAISKRAKYDKIKLDRIIDVYSSSPIFKETLRELFLEKFDVEGTKNAIKSIQNKSFSFKEMEGLSYIGEIGFKYELQDATKPDKPDAEIFKIFKNRLLKTKVRLLCMNCGKYTVTREVGDVEDQPRCSLCGSRLIAVFSPYNTEAQEIVKKRLAGKDLTTEEQNKLERIKRSADLTIVYGKNACVALAGRGVGPQTASRILARMHRNEDSFYKDILAAEKQFIKTKKYWN